MNDGTRWWLTLPLCPECGQPHVLTDCTKWLAWEQATAGGHGMVAFRDDVGPVFIETKRRS